MGCVMSTSPLEGLMMSSGSPLDRTSAAAMLSTNTISAEPMILDYEPYVNYVYRNLENNVDKTFLVDGEDGQSYSYGQLLSRSKSWAQWLQSRGISGPGHVVALLCDNDLDGFSILLGTWISGAAANPMNFNFSSGDILKMCECTLPDVIYCNKNLEILQQVMDKWQNKCLIVTPKGKYPFIDAESVMMTDSRSYQPYTVEDSKTHVVSIMFTSGTTGAPKGIQVVDYALKVLSNSEIIDFSPFMITSPIFWISNLGGFSYSLYCCSQIVIPKRGWNPRDILHTIQTYQPLAWFTGHSLLLDLCQEDFVNEYDISCLRSVVTGGTLLLANQRREINEKIFKNNLTIRHLYGSTEVGIITKWTDDIDINSDEYNSVGTLERGVTVKIIDASGRQAGPREEGEIWVKSGSMTPGYMTEKRKTFSAVDEDGWYHMGDLGFYDEKKLLYVIGRLKDIMKFRGVQIAPAEIERVLDEHPDVIESCCVGKFSVVDGDIPIAFVTLNNMSTVTIDELHQHCKDNLTEVKRPHDIIILDSIPKSAVGKVLRGELEKSLV